MELKRPLLRFDFSCSDTRCHNSQAIQVLSLLAIPLIWRVAVCYVGPYAIRIAANSDDIMRQHKQQELQQQQSAERSSSSKSIPMLQGSLKSDRYISSPYRSSKNNPTKNGGTLKTNSSDAATDVDDDFKNTNISTNETNNVSSRSNLTSSLYGTESFRPQLPPIRSQVSSNEVSNNNTNSDNISSNSNNNGTATTRFFANASANSNANALGQDKRRPSRGLPGGSRKEGYG
jgi:hypothetical protein